MDTTTHTHETTFDDVARLARHANLELWDQPHDARNGRYRVVRGRNVLHHAEDLADVSGWLAGWLRHVQ